MITMYTRLYFIYFSYLKSKNSFDATFSAASIVVLSQLVHVLLLIVLLENLMNFDVPALSGDRGTNKILFGIIAVPWIFVVYIFLKNKLAKEDLKILLKKYDYGSLKVLMIFVISF